jgi:Sulfotransferase family
MMESLAVQQPAVAPTVKVLFIMGWTRSGSTILDNLLGEIDGFFSTGELHYLWKRGLLEGRLCSCGAPVFECEVWAPVLRRAYDGAVPEASDVIKWQNKAVRVRHTWRLLRQEKGPTGWAPLDSYVPVAAALYRAIGEVTGCSVIIDSSKRPSDAAVLPLLPGVDPYFIHLVRDPRAVAYSWQRQKKELDRARPEDPEEMPRYGASYSTLGWDELNIAAEAVRRHTDSERSALIRYEDFVANPRSVLVRVTNMVGERRTILPLLDDETALLKKNHAVAGNPSRFKTGNVRLRADTTWITAIGARDRMLSTALSLPLLSRYSYPRKVPSPEKEPARVVT